jgi:hypothetical protein
LKGFIKVKHTDLVSAIFMTRSVGTEGNGLITTILPFKTHEAPR